MVRAVAGLAAVAAAALWAPARGVSLRDQLVQALDASAGLDKRAKGADGELVSCKYNADDGDRDKFCEASQSREAAPLNGCACREICHVWGDPHLSPFYDTCSAYVMNENGWHTLWELPARGGSPGMKIEAYVEMKKGNHYIQVLRVDDTDVMDVKAHCTNKKDSGSNFIRDSRMLKSDAALEDGQPADTIVEYTAYCDWRNTMPHLEVSIAIEQTGSNTAPTLPSAADYIPPPTTAMFATDSGLCTNPGGKFNCKRPSTIKENDNVEGRQCTCNAQCSAFGDPNVHDYFEKQSAKGNSFPMPREADMSSAYHIGRVLYMADNVFAVYAKMNGCDHIEEIKILVAKDANVPKGASCRPIGWDPEPRAIPLSRFHELNYNANELCKVEEDFKAETRKAIVFPFDKESEEHLTEELGGYDLGLYGTLDFTNPDVRPYRSARIARGSKPRKCMLTHGDGFKYDAEINSYLDMGGVRVTMKCHRTKKKGKAKSTAFFNVCIERTDITDDSTRSNVALSERTFADAEMAVFTSGHCALGRSTLDNIGLDVPKYTYSAHRGLDEFNYFTIEE